MHEKQLEKLQETTRTQLESVQPFLTQISSEIGQSVERIRSREKHLNEQLDGMLQEHRHTRNALAEIREKYRFVILKCIVNHASLAKQVGVLQLVKKHFNV
jgi:uncharacterized coiled-coil DUF342 family protein